MSRSTQSALPGTLASLIDGTGLDEKVGETILLVTISTTGWPHFAMLSVGELLATDERRLRLALWQGTESGTNLRRDKKASLVSVLDGAGYYVEIAAVNETTIDVDGNMLDMFDCDVTSALIDEVDYASLTSGITFELPDPASVVPRWRRTIEVMKAS